MAHQKPLQIIDVSHWAIDEQFSPYPEGSRDKDVYISPEEKTFSFIIPNHKYLFKKSNKNFPFQFWSEIAAYRIGCVVGVEVPPAFVAVNNKTNENASLIQWFYGPALKKPVVPRKKYSLGISAKIIMKLFDNLILGKKEMYGGIRYVSGGNYMARLIQNYDLKKGKQHNIRTVFTVSELISANYSQVDILEHWSKIFLFDALIGNTDRHQDNWGVVWYGSKNTQLNAVLSPAFDNGTSLGHEIMEENIDKYLEDIRMEKYISNGTHHIKWRPKDENRYGHVELIRRIYEEFPRSREVMIECLNYDDRELEKEIKTLTEFDVWDRLSIERATLIVELVCKRKKRLLRELA